MNFNRTHILRSFLTLVLTTLVGNAGDGPAKYDGAVSSPFDWGATDDDGGAAQ